MRRTAFLLALCAPRAAAQDAPPLPAVPDGFRVELIQEAPELLWPSAVHCLSDGSLLVAEDPMDMVGPADEPIDRLLLYRWTGDGGFERTVFCRDLYAVFGLQEIDGAVYVMNMPHLTVLRDADGDGVAEERRELITDLGPPAPGSPGGFNDHVVSGLRLGMDGWLYVSVGDKGVPRATGTDGSTITLRGGGVVRLRPDGTQLEVVASGTRNHLDVALDERDQIFTYDNTDDGLGWWTRLTHVIPSGRYGYPWDHLRHPERALPAMAEYGGGSPTGGLVYRGGAWPPEYQGSLYFCEWGKSALRRFVLEPVGASFQVVKDEDFMTAGGLESFRPTDVCTSPDGRFLYVADWGFGGWTNDVKCGRLFRVRRADDDGPPAGVRARPYRVEEGVTVDEPNFRARLLAQRELARIAGESPTPVVDDTARLAFEMLGPSYPRSTRRHAIWLSEDLVHGLTTAGDGTAAFVRKGLVGALASDEPELRAEAARALGSRRIGTTAELAPLLADDYAFVRREAATALGRVGDPSAAEALAETLAREDDVFVRAALRGALRALGAWRPVLARLPEVEGRARVDMELVLRGRFEPALVDELCALVDPANAPDPELRALALSLLADVARRPEPWDGVWWGTQPAKSEPPRGTLDWEQTLPVRAAIRGALADPDVTVRRAALDAVLAARDRGALSLVRARWSVEPEQPLRARVLELVEELRDDDAAPLLGRIVADPGADEALRLRAIEVASAIASPEMAALLAQAAGDVGLPVALRVQALAALGGIEDPAAVEAIRGHLRDPAAELRAAAARALVEADGDAAGEALLPMLADEAPEVRGAAAMALGELDAREALPEILELVDEPDTRAAAIDALARMPDPRALSAYVLGLEDRGRARREACADAIRSMQDEVKSALEGLHLAGEIPDKALAQLQAIYSEPAPVRRWRLLGPFAKGESAPKVADGPPDFEVPLDGAGPPLDHASAHAEGRVDLKELFTDAPNQVAYARAELDSPIARGADVVIGSDDQLALWVNGELVYEYGGDRGWAPEQARVPAQLRAGANVLVARIGQTSGAWLFNVKVGRAGEGTLFQSGLSAALDVRSYRAYALQHTGDPERGRAVFEDAAGAACVRCHAVGGEGPQVGPDLGDVGAHYGRAELATAVLEPSAQVADGYRTSWFELADGAILFAQVEREEDGRVWGVDTNGDPLELDLTEVVDRGASPLSLMPGGLTTLMSPEEFSDLLAYLESLRGGPAPLPALEDLFVAGEAGYHTFRIPALLATPDALLAICEGRREGSGDAGNIDLVMRRSTDGGRTWSGLQLVAADGVNTVGNPCPVYDRDTGQVLLFATWNKGSDTERRIMDGTSEDTRRVWLLESEDQGASWSAPRDITDQAKRPEWRWYATGPGVGIQLASGRLVVPCDHSEHAAGEHPYRSHVILSDDHGVTWRIGDVIGEKLNECQVLERRDGSLWITMRSYHGEHRRGVATSADGGETWSEPVLDPALLEPVCQASAIRWLPPEDDGHDWILHANPASESRERMTVKASPDGGVSWPFERVVYPGAAAYSSLAQLPGGEVLLLFERDGYERVTLARVLPFWKSGGR